MGKGHKEAIYKKDSNSQEICKKMLIQSSNQRNENLKQYTLELANMYLINNIHNIHCQQAFREKSSRTLLVVQTVQPIQSIQLVL